MDDSSAPVPDAAAQAWSEVAWLSSIADASLVAERLQAAFEHIMFGIAAPEDEAVVEEPRVKKRLRTAAEDEEQRELREGLRALQNATPAESEPDDDDVIDFDKISDEEEEEDAFADADGLDPGAGEEFQRWIHEAHGAPQTVTGPALRDGATAPVLRELEALQLGDSDNLIASDPLPERLGEIARRDKRPMLRPQRLPSGAEWSFDREQEAMWILRQLTARGSLLASSPPAWKTLELPQSEALGSGIVRAIVRVLELLFDEFCEPAFIMLHHRDELAPLLHALWAAGSEPSAPNPSFAYSTATGERQDPLLFPDYVGFPSLAHRTARPAVDAQFQQHGLGAPNVRKPCAIELGRLIVEILELDAQCHHVQRGQLIAAAKLQAVRSAEAALPAAGGVATPEEQRRADAEVFEAFDFCSVAEVSMWQSHLAQRARHCASVQSDATSPQHRARLCALGLAGAFEVYVLAPQLYQRNLLHRFQLHTAPAAPTEDVYAWAAGEAQRAGVAAGAEAVLDLFNMAAAEEIALLPLVCKRVFDLVCSDGICVITPTRSTTGERRSIKVSRLLEVNQRRFLDFVHAQDEGLARVELLVSEALVREELCLERFINATSAPGASPWAQERDKIVHLVVPRVVRHVMQLVRATLQHEAERSVARGCMRALGNLCASGPYERTRLALQGFDERAPAWDAGWNCVEALPAATGEAPRACGVFRGDNGIVVLAVVDESGRLRGACRWVDYNRRTAEGREADKAQRAQLLALFRQCPPTVIAVAATTASSNGLVGQLREFVQRDVQDELQHDVQITWVPGMVAMTYAWSEVAETEMPRADVLLRGAVSVARFVIDPLLELCRLFDPTARDVLKLPLGTHSGVDAGRVFHALRWEMSLWVTACGVDLNAALERADPAAVLQFVAGLGPRKAAQAVNALVGSGRIHSRAGLEGRLGADRFAIQNAIASLRVFPPTERRDMGGDSMDHHELLDATLIHPRDYDVARLVLRRVMKASSTAVAAARLVLLDESERRQLLMTESATREFLTWASEQQHLATRRALLEFIVDELCALGRSYMRRPFRQLSMQLLMKLVTGVQFVRRGVAAALDDSSLVVREGDVVFGTVTGISVAPPGVRVRTSHGISAFINGDDIASPLLREALQDAIIVTLERREQQRRGVALSAESADAALAARAPALARGAIVHGEVIGVNYRRCEVRLRHVPAPEPRPRGPETIAAAAGGAVDQRDADRSSRLSVRTVDLEAAAYVNATKFSRHVLFRAVSATEMHALLSDRGIGEVLLRPRADVIDAGVACVRVGEMAASVMHIPFTELRNHDATLRYVVTDRRLRERIEYSDVDHLLAMHVEGVVRHVHSLREHRRFQPNREEGERAVQQQLAQDPRRIAYSFIEHCSPRSPQHFYHALLRLPGAAATSRVELYLGSSGIYLCLREGKVRCHSAEDVAAQLKLHFASRASATAMRARMSLE